MSTRADVSWMSLHNNTRLHGLRLIDNNYVSDGTGRDWNIFGDPGYHGGRRTPLGPDRNLAPVGDRPSNIGPIARPPGDGRRPKPLVARGKDGAPLMPLPSTVRRWQRVASMPCVVDKEARSGEPALENPNDKPIMHYLSQDEQGKLDTMFKPNMAARPFHMGTFPVEKYRYFGEGNITKVPSPRRGEHDGPDLSTYTMGNIQNRQRLDGPVISSHHYFSEDSLRQSLQTAHESPKESLAAARRRTSASAAALAMDRGQG